MSDQITEKTVEWCRTHDWGQHAYFVNDPVIGPTVKGLIDDFIDADGRNHHDPAQFTSRRDLREWAGY